MDNLSDLPITQTYLAAAFLTTTLCHIEAVSPFSLFLSPALTFGKLQLWRLLTNFFFFSPKFSLDFLYHMFFLYRYCGSLESDSFQGRPADFLYLIIFGGTLMTLMACIFDVTFLGPSLTFMMVYIWGRRNPGTIIGFFDVITFSAPYLPWVLLGFSGLMGNTASAWMDLLGIGCGHLYYYLEDVFPKMVPSRRRLLKTPRILTMFFEGNRAHGQEHLEEAVPLDDDHAHHE
jgi:Derlin-2/3